MARRVIKGQGSARRWAKASNWTAVWSAAAAVVAGQAVQGAITHRYSFDGNANDSAGTAHGTPVSRAGTPGITFSGGQVFFNNTGTTGNVAVGNYVDLPNNIATTANLTIEGWVTWNTGATAWQRIFDFGVNGAGEIAPEDTTTTGYGGTESIWVSPLQGVDTGNGRNNNFGSELVEAAGVNRANAPANFNFNSTGTGEHHFALVKNAANNTLSLYLDGNLVGQATNATINPANVDMRNVWLGRSNWSADPFFSGSMNEFRIHDTALSNVAVAQSFATGPDSTAAGGNIQWQAVNGDWAVGSNWSGGAAPQGADAAIIANGGTANVNGAVSGFVTRINHGTLNLNNGGSLAPFQLELVPGATGTASINLNGGTLTVRNLTLDTGAGAESINFNDGTLVAVSNLNFSFTNPSSVGALGATFDVPTTSSGGTSAVNWSPALNVTPGGTLTKLGSGRLNLLGSGFEGPVRVLAGRLDAAGSVGATGTTLQLGDSNVVDGTTAALFLTAPGTIRGPITVGTGSGNYTLGVGNNSAVTIPGAITMNAPLTISTAATTGTNSLTISGGITATGAANELTFTNNGLVVVDTAGINESGTFLRLSKNGTGMLMLMAPNNYTGGTLINQGAVFFNGPSSVGGEGANVFILAAGAAVAGPGFDHTNIKGTFLPRIDPLSGGTMALTQNSSEDFNMETLGYPTLFLGAGSNITYTGTLTPAQTQYRIGGGGGAMVLPNTNAITGANQLIVSGAGGGTVELTGANDYTGGTVVQSGGRLILSNANQVGTGGINLATGSLQVNGTAPVTLSLPISVEVGGGALDVRAPSLTLTGGMSGPGADTTALNKTGPGDLILSNNTYDLAARPFLFHEGTLRLQNGASFSAAAADAAFVSIAQGGTERASLVLSDTSSISVGEGLNIGDVGDTRATLFVRDNASISARGLFLGKNNTSQGAALQTGGAVNSRLGVAGALPLDWRLGGNNSNANDANAVGTYTMTGGTFGTTGNLHVGARGKGALTVNGGTASVGGSTDRNVGFPSIGRFAPSYGVLTVENTGRFEQMTPGNFLIVGEQGTGFLNVENGGTVVANGGIRIGLTGAAAPNVGGRGFVNLRPGGTITTANISGAPTAANVTSHFNFHGGTLKPLASSTGFMDNLQQAYVWQGGAIIDTDGKDITIRQGLSAPTGQGVTTIPLTAGGSGYVAHPVVEITGGGGTGAAAVAILDAGGTVTGIRVTNPGVGYTSAPTINLRGGAAATPATLGTATLGNNVGGGLTKTGTGTLTLAGPNTYAGPTLVQAGTLRVGSPVMTGLTHRYSFTNDANDSVGEAHGQLVNGAAVTGGQVVLNNAGNSTAIATGQYVDLPNNIARTSSLTIEGWATWGGTTAANWNRIFDFGINNQGEQQPGVVGPGYAGTSAIYVTPRSGPDAGNGRLTNLGAELRVAPVSRFANARDPAGQPFAFGRGAEHHFALVRDAGTDTLSLYYDGQLVAQNTQSIEDPALIEMVNMWLGRSNWSGDPFMGGSINEFRIYDNALTAAGVAANFAAGPDGTISTNFAPASQGGSLPATSAVTVASGATLEANASMRIASLNVNSGGKAVVGPGGPPTVLTTGALTVAPSGTVDVTSNGMVVDYAPEGPSPLSDVRAAIVAGYNDGTWNGSGIISSTAQTTPGRSVGYGEASALYGPGGGTFMGQNVDGSAVLVRYTVTGDADLNGIVAFPDLVALAQNYNTSDGSAVWTEGDFTYDGNVTFPDLVALAQNYNTSLPTAAQLDAIGASALFQQDLAAAFAQVPEPGALSLLVLGAAGITGRRRRKR